jgi:hypothetical protein
VIFLLPQRRDLLLFPAGFTIVLNWLYRIFIARNEARAWDCSVRLKSSGDLLALQFEKITTMNELCMEEFMYGWLKGVVK